MKNTPKFIIVHHEAPPTVVSGFRFFVVNQYHKSRGFPISSLGLYVGYHYFIEKSGEVRKARIDYEEGAHTVGMNLDSLGICLAGNFDLELPTHQQRLALQRLLREKSSLYMIPKSNIVPHRKFAQKSCYGLKLSDTWAQDLLDNENEQITILRKLISLYQRLLETIKGRKGV